jgi:dTDP-glucose pyrophosphorylase
MHQKSPLRQRPPIPRLRTRRRSENVRGIHQVDRQAQMKTDLSPFLVESNVAILQALHLLEECRSKVLFVVDKDRVLRGSLTDGDIRRWILAGGGLQGDIGQVCHLDPVSVGKGYRKSAIRALMLESGIEGIPVLDTEGRVIDILFWKDLFREEEQPQSRSPGHLEAPVVIMAGGKGNRLAPFTSILPKPLIPVGGKAILEVIIDRFHGVGCREFIVSVHHKARIIRSYFEELAPPYAVEFLEEDSPSGTAGALSLLASRFDRPFFVTNCDILVEADYAEIMAHHVEKGNLLTIVASLKRYTIPYGICRLGEGGVFERIEEKPEYGYLVNTGMYVLSPEALDFLPKGCFVHMTDLISIISNAAGRVGVFPIGENRWFDTGEWAEYHKTLHIFGSGAG